MGSEETKLDLETVRLFKRDVQENLERQARGRQQVEKRGGAAATAKARDMPVGGGTVAADVFGMYVIALSGSKGRRGY
jgi:DNA polymerase alpha subunit B